MKIEEFKGCIENIDIVFTEIVQECVHDYIGSQVENDQLPRVFFEKCKNKAHGDFTTNIAMQVTKIAKKPPRVIGDDLKEILQTKLNEKNIIHFVEFVEVAGPGFINIKLSKTFFRKTVHFIHLQDTLYGIQPKKNDETILIEFVSANPTGPLSIAHARQAVVGDALAKICDASGYTVTKEYYLNDVGNQIRILGLSTLLRYKQLLGQSVDFPEDGYQGDYVKDIALEFQEIHNDAFANASDDLESLTLFSDFAVERILKTIKKDLIDFDVQFDTWYSQKTLHEKKLDIDVLEYMKSKELAYEKDGALWFRSSDYGDDKDRVLIKSDKTQTYLTPDIAYHRAKFQRGYKQIINIWGPDHHGYIPRIRAAVEALGFDEKKLHVLIIQLTTLYRGDKQLKMSTRAGKLVTLRQLLDEIGRDTSRFFLLARKGDSHLDFDLELAKSTTVDNPVYYVQYAHARICSITRLSEEKDIFVPEASETLLDYLNEPEEFDLIRTLQQYPLIIRLCCEQYDPCRLTAYLRDLAGSFHSFYSKHKVITEDIELSQGRLLLIQGVRIVLRNGLNMLGISAPEKM